MIKGIGIDLVSISRIEEILLRTPRFECWIPNSKEMPRTPRELAGDIAIFEALFKALPNEDKRSIRDFRVKRDSQGKPIIDFLGESANIIDNMEVSVSVSHEGDWVVAIAIIHTK
jgi:holo-[acyl-carrier-protein] synthase